MQCAHIKVINFPLTTSKEIRSGAILESANSIVKIRCFYFGDGELTNNLESGAEKEGGGSVMQIFFI